jgi:hypothetical protein
MLVQKGVENSVPIGGHWNTEWVNKIKFLEVTEF